MKRFATLAIFATTANAWSLRSAEPTQKHGTIEYSLKQHRDGSVHVFEEQPQKALVLGKSWEANTDNRVFKVHGNQEVTGTLQIDGGLKISQDRFNIFGKDSKGDESAVFDLDVTEATDVVEVYMGFSGDKRLKVKQGTDSSDTGFYACSICTDTVPATSGDNQERAATERMVRHHVANPDTAVSMADSLTVAKSVTVGEGVSTGQNGISVSYDNKAVANDNTYGSATLDSSGLALDVINSTSEQTDSISLSNRQLMISFTNDKNYGEGFASVGVEEVSTYIQFPDGTTRIGKISGQTLQLTNTDANGNEITTLNNEGYSLELPGNKEIALNPSGLQLLDNKVSITLDQGGLLYDNQDNGHIAHLSSAAVGGTDGTNTYELDKSGLSTKDSNGKIDLKSKSSGVSLVLDDNTDVSILTPKTLELKNGDDTAALSTTQLDLGQAGKNVTLTKGGLVANDGNDIVKLSQIGFLAQEGSNTLSLTKDGVAFYDGSDSFNLQKSGLGLEDGSNSVTLDVTNGLKTEDGTNFMNINSQSLDLLNGDNAVSMSANIMSLGSREKDDGDNDVLSTFDISNSQNGISSVYKVGNLQANDWTTHKVYTLNYEGIVAKTSENEKVDISKDSILLSSSEKQSVYLTHDQLALTNDAVKVDLSAAGLTLDTGTDVVTLNVNSLSAPKADATLQSLNTGNIDATSVLVQNDVASGSVTTDSLHVNSDVLKIDKDTGKVETSGDLIVDGDAVLKSNLVFGDATGNKTEEHAVYGKIEFMGGDAGNSSEILAKHPSHCSDIADAEDECGKQVVTMYTLKKGGASRYEYMVQVLCNTLGLNYTQLEAAANAWEGEVGRESKQTIAKFGGINPAYQDIGALDDSDNSTYYDVIQDSDKCTGVDGSCA